MPFNPFAPIVSPTFTARTMTFVNQLGKSEFSGSPKAAKDSKQYKLAKEQGVRFFHMLAFVGDSLAVVSVLSKDIPFLAFGQKVVMQHVWRLEDDAQFGYRLPQADQHVDGIVPVDLPAGVIALPAFGGESALPHYFVDGFDDFEDNE